MEKIIQIQNQIESVFLGKRHEIRLAIITLLAKGHLLVEDIPGVGKTLLAACLSRTIGATFERVQCTSDLLPSDLIGVSIFSPQKQVFEFKKGPIFSNLILVDEINRTTPKTQSALLEAMNETQVSVDGVTYFLPSPFMIIATQNPLEHHGTFPLPDSQLDRFLIRINIGYPDMNYEKQVLKTGDGFKKLDDITSVVTLEEIVKFQNLVNEVQVDNSLIDYVWNIVDETRKSQKLKLGISPRGGIALISVAKACAFLDGRNYCIPDDIKQLTKNVLSHRIISDIKFSFKEQENIIEEILKNVSVPV